MAMRLNRRCARTVGEARDVVPPWRVTSVRREVKKRSVCPRFGRRAGAVKGREVASDVPGIGGRVGAKPCLESNSKYV